MNEAITGSYLTRAMLESGHKEIWCAVDDSSDKQAMMGQANNDFTARIVSFHDGHFFCINGTPWLCAVPIKISAMTQDEVQL